MRIIEEVLKIKNDIVLDELIGVINRSKLYPEERPSIKDFLGIWSHEEAEEIKRVIEESFGQINPDDWK